jgi:predicted Zn-dependent protease
LFLRSPASPSPRKRAYSERPPDKPRSTFARHLRGGPWARVLVFLLLILLLLPAPGRAFLGDFTIKDEMELGRKFNVLIRSRFPLIQDPVILGYVRDTVRDIQEIMPPQPFPVTVSVLRASSINAFAAPAGYLFVHSGLILNMESHAQVAAVIAHELAHVSQRHLARNIERSRLINIGTLVGVLAGALVGGQVSGEAGEALMYGSMAGGQSASLKYSRDDEREADEIGLRYLAEAGFPPEGMAGAFQQIWRKNMMGGSGSLPAYMSTHPGLRDRIGYIQNMAQGLGAAPEHTIGSYERRFHRVRMLLRAKYTDPNTAIRYYSQQEDLSCLDRLGKAILLQRLNDIAQARALFAEANRCGGEDPLWLRETGRFHFKQGEFERAHELLERAVAQEPDDHLARYYYAKVLAETGRTGEAAEALRRILRHMPHEEDVHETLGRILGTRGDSFSGFLHFAYAAMYRNDKKRTRYYLDRVKRLAESPEERAELEKLQEELEARKKYW